MIEINLIPCDLVVQAAAAFCLSQGVGALDPNGKLQRQPHVEASSQDAVLPWRLKD